MTHVDWCPRAPALIATWAVGRHDRDDGRYRPWANTHHPPASCAHPDCSNAVVVSVRHVNQSNKGAVYCGPDCYVTAVAARERIQAEESAGLAEARRARAEAQRAERAAAPKPCPRPDKLAYDTSDEVRRAFADLIAAEPELGPYECVCGRWHAGNSPANALANAAATAVEPLTFDDLQPLPAPTFNRALALGARARITHRKEKP